MSFDQLTPSQKQQYDLLHAKWFTLASSEPQDLRRFGAHMVLALWPNESHATINSVVGTLRVLASFVPHHVGSPLADVMAVLLEAIADLMTIWHA